MVYEHYGRAERLFRMRPYTADWLPSSRRVSALGLDRVPTALSVRDSALDSSRGDGRLVLTVDHSPSPTAFLFLGSAVIIRIVICLEEEDGPRGIPFESYRRC